MTDRLHGFAVALENDIREDDAEATIAAIRQIRGVLSVTPIVTDIATHIARERLDAEWRRKIYELVRR